MRTSLKGGLAVAFGILAAPALAEDSGLVQVDLNMRAGPSTEFPVVVTIPENSRVTVHGCIQGRNWCDISWRDDRGWVSAQHLGYRYQDRIVPIYDYYEVIEIPFITFTFGDYWDRHYRGRPWYDRRDRWRVIWRDGDRDRDRDRDGLRERRDDRAERPAERREGRDERQERRERAEGREQQQERAVERRGGDQPAIGRGMSPGERGGSQSRSERLRSGPGTGPTTGGGGGRAGGGPGGGGLGAGGGAGGAR